MSLQNLAEDFLYDLLPEGIIDLDEQGLIQAVVGGYQDRVDDLRSYTSKFELLVTGNGLPETDNDGNPVNNVVLCQIQSPQGKVYNRSLDFKDDTPDNGTSDLFVWAQNQLALDADHILLSAAYGVDALRLVDANILGYLATTIGAVLYQTAAMDPNNAQNDARRLIQTWFPRLQFKGTSQSFETLGRLLGFDDVRMMPLFGRLSPRIANDIGDPANNQDFSTTPDYFPKQARDNFYDPWVLNDGPFFTWSGTASARFGTADTSFYSQVVNGFNPFVTVSVVGTAPVDPDPAGSPYILVGGGPETQASVTPPGSGLLFKAISAGSSFNGLQINFNSVDNGTYRQVSITDRLSAIKYRTSFYDLALTLDMDHALAQFGTNVASTNKDLQASPTSANFGATALSPFRPWQGGSIAVEMTVADWLHQVKPNGNLTIKTARTQADLTNREFDMESISAAGAQVVQAMEEVRPATRSPRQISTGFLIRDQIGYAEYCAQQSLFTTQGASQGTYSGTLTGFPFAPYNVEFASVTSSAGTVPMVGETDLINSGFVRFTSPDLKISGTYNYANSTWLFAFTGVQTGTLVLANYFPTSSEVIRPDPGTNCRLAAYQMRPEDLLDTPVVDMADEYPWRRDIVGGGELIDFDTYNPATPDIQTVRLGQTASVFSQTGAQYDVQVVVPGPYPPRFVTAERSLDGYVPGQRAIAYTGTFLDLAGSRPSTGTLAGGLDGVMQPGWKLYHFGLVQGVLVADAPKFFGKHHREGLALWYPFNEQPLDAIEVLDHSPYNGRAFITGLSSGDRKFDPVRGNYLAAQPGLTLNSPIARGFGQKFAGGFWLRAMHSYSTEQTILSSGPLRITLSGAINTPSVKFYLVAPNGTANLQATQAFNQNWVYVAWSFNDSTNQLTVDFWNSSGNLTEQVISVATPIDFGTPYSFALTCPNSAFDIQDLRLWNLPKTSDLLALARYHNPTPTACLYRPAWLQSVNTYDNYAVRVLPSGYVVPDQLPTSIITDQLAWVQRYDYLARYQAQSRYKETGIGAGNTLPPKQYLGAQWDTLTADGTVAVSTWQGNYVGVNDRWLFDSPKGTIIVLPESGSTIFGIPGTLTPTGTASPWPNAMQATNPCRDRIWLKGDDGFVWQAKLSNTEAGAASFTTQKLFSVSGSYQPTGAHVLLSTTNNQLAVNTSGTVYCGTYTGTVITDPLYMYANEETALSLSGSSIVSAWVQPNLFGLNQPTPVPALNKNGQIAFQVNSTMLPGFYQLQVTSGNIGKVDNFFSGFATVITVGDVPFQAKLCGGQTGSDFSQTDTFEFYLDHTLPGSPSSWLLTFDWSNALKDAQKGTARQLEISAVTLTRFHTSLYRVSLSPPNVSLTLMSTSGTAYPTTPGGWLAVMSSWGTAQSYMHESTVYSVNDTLRNPQPFSNKLGATTMYRRESLILNGSFTLPDPSLPIFVTYGTIDSPCNVSVGPACITDTGISFNTIAGQPDGPLTQTRDASTRILALVDADNGKVVFVDTSSNTVVNTITLASTAIDGSRFKQCCFSTSNKRFFFQTNSTTVTVTDSTGNVVGTISPPANTNFAGDPLWVYSPEADKVYTFLFNSVTSSQHIYSYNPSTLALVDDSDTGNSDNQGIMYYPNNIVLYGSFLRNYPISTLTMDKSSAFFQTRAHAEYDPIKGRIFMGQSFTNNIVAFKTSDLTIDTTFTPVTNAAPVEFLAYNPITQVMIAYNLSMEITVIDPNANVILCETNNLDPSGGGGGIGIDYSSGNVYLFDEDWINNPLKVWH